MRPRAALLAAAAMLAAAMASPALAGDAARGRALANERGCAGCHGSATSAAVPNAPSLAGQPPEFQVLQLILFRERLRNAPPMPDLVQGMTDDQFEDLASHFAGLERVPPDDLAPRDGQLVARGEALSGQMRCGTCHLPDYSGREHIPRLAGQREDFLLRTLQEYRDNARVGADTSMNAVVFGVPDADLAALAHFLARAP